MAAAFYDQRQPSFQPEIGMHVRPNTRCEMSNALPQIASSENKMTA
jgi:hypothetical protein